MLQALPPQLCMSHSLSSTNRVHLLTQFAPLRSSPPKTLTGRTPETMKEGWYLYGFGTPQCTGGWIWYYEWHTFVGCIDVKGLQAASVALWTAGMPALRLVTYAEPNCQGIGKRSGAVHANVTGEAGHNGALSTSKERRGGMAPQGQLTCNWYPGMSVFSYEIVPLDGW